MITKTVRPGGDFTSITDIVSFFDSLDPQPLEDDYTFNFKGGATFGSDDDYTVLGNFGVSFNGHDVVFQTDPVELLTIGPARVLGVFKLYIASGSSGAGSLIFRQIKLGYNQYQTDPGYFTASLGFNNTVIWLIENCEVSAKSVGAAFSIMNGEVDGGHHPSCRMINCTVSIESGSLVAINLVNGTYGRQHNNLILLNTSEDIEVNLNSNDVNKNNKVFNYGSGAVTIVNNGTGSNENCDVVTDPKLAQNALDTANDSVATMLSKNLKETANSNQTIQQGNNSVAPSVDILGNIRPFNTTVDVGAHEVDAAIYSDIIVKDFLSTITHGNPIKISTVSGGHTIKIHETEFDLSSTTIDLGIYYTRNEILRSYRLRAAVAANILNIESGIITPTIDRVG